MLFYLDEGEWRMGWHLVHNDEYLRTIHLLTEIALTFKMVF